MNTKINVCPHCNKEVKRVKHKDIEKEYKCLECDGNYIMDPYGRPKKSMSDKGNVTIGFMALIAIIGICVYTCYPSDDEQTTQIETDIKKPEEKIAFDVSAVDMYNEWEEHEVKWNAKYMKKIGQVTGKVTFLGMTGDAAYLLLDTNHSLWKVRCTFKKPEEIQDVSKGQVVTIKGKVTSDFMDIALINCKLIK